jgi:gamma-glutamylcyclotransferase (GGCT)/AIG2-like uncharacterized protein YtfP
MSTEQPTTKRIAVYGSLRKSEYNYRKDMGEPIACGRIQGAQLFSLGAFPCIIVGDAEDTVEAEVYELPEKVFNSIEAMELGAGYKRCVAPFAEHDGPIYLVEAYFYPAKADWFGPRIESGDWSLRGNTL